jgi:putative methionine-R-sulfoxide reductase with GAF domain
MDTRHIVENGIVSEPLPPDSPQPKGPGTESAAELTPAGELCFPGEDGGKSLAAMAQRDLMATLQLLAERARYITGATGAAIALRDNEEMTCRASAGTSAPEVGAHLQVDSGLSGESVRSMKTLRCDDAASDPRVNRESCEALGIASVVVMPLVRGDKVIGVFELFSDKPHVFEARDITALERMGAMVYTALEQALSALQAKADAEFGVPGEPGEGVGAAATGTSGDGEFQPALAAAEAPGDYPQAAGETGPREASSFEPIEGAADSEAAGGASYAGVAFHMKPPARVPTATPLADPAEPDGNDADDILGIASEAAATNPSETQASLQEEVLGTDISPRVEELGKIQETPQPGFEKEMSGAVVPASSDEQAAPAAPRSEVSNLRRCEGCGFPVSEGRQFCLDCERKAVREQHSLAKSAAPTEPAASNSTPAPRPSRPAPADSVPMPQFLHDESQDASWLAAHKYTVGAIVVAVAGMVIFFLAR